MTGQSDSRSEQSRAFYDAAAAATDFSLMNYGYAPVCASSVEATAPERYCLSLYDYILEGAALRDRHVLEVSCGRGGGAAYIAATREPASYTGVDISEQNIGIASQRFSGVQGLCFRTGNAESLSFPDGGLDAVINVEASHLYDDPRRFFREVHRVLRPGGIFFYADLFWRDKEPERLIADAGLVVTRDEDITGNVLRALELDTERREQIVQTGFPPHLHESYRNWSGVKGYRAYNRFESGEWIYRCLRAHRDSG